MNNGNVVGDIGDLGVDPSVGAFKSDFARHTGLAAVYQWLNNEIQPRHAEYFEQVLLVIREKRYFRESGIDVQKVTYTPDGRLYLLGFVLSVLDADTDTWHGMMVEVRSFFRTLAVNKYKALQYVDPRHPKKVEQQPSGEKTGPLFDL